MIFSLRTILFATTAVACAVGCSAASDVSETSAQSTEALRALDAREIVGTLQYGQTSASVPYTETPKYRAFRFEGRAGDAVDAWVRSTSGDARAWLLDAAFLNVTSNDNADVGTHDSHLTSTLTQSGTYYIAFREATGEDASFTVSLANGATRPPPACDPEVDNCTGGPGGVDDPFDPASCTGPKPTVAEAERWFPLGATSVKVADAKEYVQKRTCVQRASGPECTPWANVPLSSTKSLHFRQNGVLVLANIQVSDAWNVTADPAHYLGALSVGVCSGRSEGCKDEASSYLFGDYVNVTLTNHCVRVADFSYSSHYEGATTWYERRGAMLGRFSPR